jgi:hypothetical protein
MVFINEWFPNPTGIDAKAEFIELFNSGNAPVNLAGWVLKTTNKKTFLFAHQTINANGYLVLRKEQTKLTLKNANESLSLFNSSGNLVDQSSFIGAAQEGKSLSRINYGTDPSDHFAWSAPTPGAVNQITLDTSISVNPYPVGAPLNNYALGVWEVFGMALLAGAFFTALMVYSLEHEKRLQKLFFPRDGGVRE